jgi:Tol biopolymer transport system component
MMDNEGRKLVVAGAKSAYLPAWTTDGKRIAYLEKSGRKKYVLQVVEVTMPGK